ncbi:head maturation protease, ClpP-related [Micromonospora aurantiaca]|uniref:head maturation protease, ClpP-related n=1 Tax=Micromonospora aurantiaca (nom. illeg.) TaxID=47850 RepID=UPI00342CAA68
MTSIHTRRLETMVARTTARFLELAAQQNLTVADLPQARLPWFEVRNGDGSGRPGQPPTVLIFDEIGGSLGVKAKEFVETIEGIDSPTIRVRINSPGGSVFDALAIHSALLHHQARIEVYVDGLAASAASVIAMAGDELIMMPGSQLMIHDASMLEQGNPEDHRKASVFLDRQSDNLADLYARRGGGEPAEWRELMRAETWMFAREAVEAGLADRVDVLEIDENEEPEQRRRMRRSFDLSGYRYAGREAAPAPARRGAVADTTGAPQRQQREHSPRAVTSPRPPSVDQLAEAARRRAATLRDRGTPPGAPGGQARSVSTAWMSRAVAGTSELPPLPPRLTAQRVERDGKVFYRVGGYFTVHERGYEMWDENGPYTEVVSAGAGDKTLAANPEVIFLVNHRGLAMARSTAGTLELWSDRVGDGNTAWLNPQRADVMDLVHGIEDKTITEQSFAFMIEAGHWNADFTEYRIDVYDLDRGDTSAVNYGANPHTSIAARAREILDELEHLPAGAARAAMDRLSNRRDQAQRPDEPAAPVAADPPTSGGRTVADMDAWLATVNAGM